MPKILFYIYLVFALHTSGIGQNKKPVINNIMIEEVKCHNQPTGRAEIRVKGGKPPYLYSLDGKHFQQEPVFNRLKAGHYRVYLKDASGNLNTATFEIKQPEKIHFTLVKTTNSHCCEPNGALLVQASGGTGSMQYQLNEGVFRSSGYFRGLSGGYTVVARDSLGCKASLAVKIDDFNGPVIDFLNSTEVSCYNGSNGSITIYSIGGTGTVQYSVDGKNWQSSPVFTQLKAGTYLARVRDETGCSDSTGIVISQPDEIEASVIYNRMPSGLYTVTIEYSVGGTGTHDYSLNGTQYQGTGVMETPAAPSAIYVKDAAGCVSLVKTVGHIFSMKKTDH